MHEKLLEQFNQALIQLKINIDINQQNLCISFLSELEKWNKTYNLTAIKTVDKMMNVHLYDSLSIFKYIKKDSKTIADIGTGAGLPGVMLAIYFPHIDFILIDSVSKKIKFIEHIKRKLKIKNIFPIHTRVEDYKPEMKFQQIISRAMSSAKMLQDLSSHLLDDNGEFLIMKGNNISNEIAEINTNIKLNEVTVPFLDAKRNILRWKK